MLYGGHQKFYYTLALAYERSGYIKDARNQHLTARYSLGKLNTYNSLLKLGYHISDKQTIEASYMYYGTYSFLDLERTTPGTYGVTPTIGQKVAQVIGVPQGTPYNHNASLTYKYTSVFKNTDLRINLYFQKFRTVYEFNTIEYIGGGQLAIDNEKAGLRIDMHTRLLETNRTTLNVLYGADILHDNTVQKTIDDRNRNPDMNMFNLAPFALLTWHLDKKLIIKIGARSENDLVRVSNFNTLPRRTNKNASFPPAVFVQGGDLRYYAFVGNAGIRYNIVAPFNVFFNFSQGFSLNDLGRELRSAQKDGTAKITVKTLNPQPIIVNNYELGFEGHIGGIVSYQATAYVSTSKLGSSFIARNGVYLVERKPEIIYGADGYVHIKPTSFLETDALFTYIAGRVDNGQGNYKDYLNSARIPPSRVVSYITVYPLKKWSITLKHQASFGRSPFSKIKNKNGEWIYNSGEGPIPANYKVLLLTTTYAFHPHFKLSLGIENLLNT